MADFDPVKAGQEAAKANAKADKAGITKAEMNFDQEVGTAEVTIPEGPVLHEPVDDEVEEKSSKKVDKKSK